MLIRRVFNRLQNYSASTVRKFIGWGSCFALILSSFPTLPVVIGKSTNNSKIHLTQGAPGRNLPNLDNARHMTSVVPKMLSQVSITKPSVRKINTTGSLLSNLLSPSFMVVGAAGSVMLAMSDWFSSSNATVKNKEAVKAYPLATKITQPASSVTVQSEDDGWETALLDPKNRVGTGGEDLLSRNYNWGLPLVSLPGRAGMDLNLGLSLNSLIWTKAGGNIHFDLDKGFPSAGFHLGLPELGTAFYDSEAGVGAMLVTMPSGMRYKFRQNTTLGQYVYEEQTGANMILVITLGLTGYKSNTWKILTPDGTTYTFKVISSSPKCTEIKDRNGNYISIAYTSFERISTFTDTLGRVVNFNYDSNNRLTSITQNWASAVHTYATFSYADLAISAGFLSLNMIGAQNGQTISVLSKVGLADGSVYTFDYNTYAQVHTIKRFAPNTATPTSFPGEYTQLSSVSYDLPRDAMGEQTDCPRFGIRTDSAKDWNINNGVPTRFDGDLNSQGSVTTPDRVIHKEIFGTSGWQRGLTLQTETWYEGVRKKWTETSWQNGSVSASYLINPQIVETNIYDQQGNRKRTKINYTDYNSVSEIQEFSSNATDIYRSTLIEYQRGTTYIDNKNRRMTNLVKSQSMFDGAGTLQSKVTYEYDLGGEYLVHQGPPIRHDSTKYGASFVQGRGNVNVARQWDVTDSSNINKTLVAKTNYNTSGSVINTIDGLDHKTEFIYTDSFSGLINTNTLAYVTTAKDADGNASTVQYNFDFGALTKAQNPKGATTIKTFDSIGRLERLTNQVNGAYTKYVYASNQTTMQTYSTINDLTSELHSISVFDGHGRVRATASDHPGSIGGRKAQYVEFDAMGRQIRHTNPTEIDVNWNSTGDDSTGFVWNIQEYDWKGRPITSINPEGTRKTISYDNCGCTGINTATFTDEVGRKKKDFYDVFGQLWKSQNFNWDGSVYSTSTITYNVLGLQTRINVQQGEYGVGQEKIMTYDGFGRLNSRKLPIESSPTFFKYNNDGTISSVTDPRGVMTTFSYNNRHLVTGRSYNNVSGVITSSQITFGYDETGNRLWMDDQAGKVDYHYDTMSRMDWEERKFDDIQQSYRINYEYNFAGQLKKLADPWGGVINYIHDKAGRVTDVTGVGFADKNGVIERNVTQFVSGIKYRAWSGIKSMTYGDFAPDKANFAIEYNAQSQMTRFEGGGKFTQHSFYNDGRLSEIVEGTDNTFNRKYEYDHLGRLKMSQIGTTNPIPAINDYQYDVWSNMLSISGSSWGTQYNNSSTFVNNRDVSLNYDASGNVIDPPEAGFPTSYDLYNSENRLAKWVTKQAQNAYAHIVDFVYDGYGEKNYEHFYNDDPNYSDQFTKRYYIRSSQLDGKVICEVTNNGTYVNVRGGRNIYFYGNKIAYEYMYSDPSYHEIVWIYHNPITKSTYEHNRMYRGTNQPEDKDYTDGIVNTGGGGVYDGAYDDDNDSSNGDNSTNSGDPSDYCVVDGIETSCSDALRMVNNGSAVIVPNGETVKYNEEKKILEVFRAYADGTQGYVAPGYIPGREYTYSYTLKNTGVDEATGKRVNAPGQDLLVIVGYESALTQSPNYHLMNLGQGERDSSHPQLPSGTRREYVEAFTQGLAEAFRRLENPRCLELFGFDSSEPMFYGEAINPVGRALQATEFRFLSMGAPTRVPGTENFSVIGASTNHGNPPSVFINTQGPYMNQRLFVPGGGSRNFDLGSGLGGNNFRAFVLLHELGHIVGIFGPDAHDAALNRRYSQRVLDSCFR